MRTKNCDCWDCLRSRGATPPVDEGRAKRARDGSLRRNVSLFAGFGPMVPPDADLNGADRPIFRPAAEAPGKSLGQLMG